MLRPGRPGTLHLAKRALTNFAESTESALIPCELISWACTVMPGVPRSFKTCSGKCALSFGDLGVGPGLLKGRGGGARVAPSGFSPAGHDNICISMNFRSKQAAGHPSWSLALLALFAAIGVLGAGPGDLLAANLSPNTVKAFDRYVEAAEARMKSEESHPGDFLYIDSLPKPQYEATIQTLEHGGVYVQQLHTLDAKGQPINIPGGMINHWVGDIFIPGRSVSFVLDVLRDYNNFKNIYKPEIIRSRLISREDQDDYKIYLRLQKKSIVTVTLDTWYNIHFMTLGPAYGYSSSMSTRIQQVEDAGTPDEHLDPVGQDSGYLWRINSYWRYEKHGNGVIIEWESIALSRQIPFLLAWFVKPLIRGIARETVQNMLTATRKAVLAEKPLQSESKIDLQLSPLRSRSALTVRR